MISIFLLPLFFLFLHDVCPSVNGIFFCCFSYKKRICERLYYWFLPTRWICQMPCQHQRSRTNWDWMNCATKRYWFICIATIRHSWFLSFNFKSRAQSMMKANTYKYQLQFMTAPFSAVGGVTKSYRFKRNVWVFTWRLATFSFCWI